MYYYRFPMVSATATIALFVKGTNKVILGKRVETSEAYPNYWSLPGGFLDAKHVPTKPKTLKGWIAYILRNTANMFEKGFAPLKPGGETVEDTAVREVFEETNLTIKHNDLNLYHVHSDPNIDPRTHVVNVCYWVDIENLDDLKPKDDITEFWIYDLDENPFENLPDLAFNHRKILEDAIVNRKKVLGC